MSFACKAALGATAAAGLGAAAAARRAAGRPAPAAPRRAAAAPPANARLATEAKYKLKTNKSAAKRFRTTGTGKVVRRCAGKAHINEHKSAKQLKRLSTKKVVRDTEHDNIQGMMPYLRIDKKSGKK